MKRTSLIILAVAGTLMAATPAAADGPLDNARYAAVGMSYTGRVLVRWVDKSGLHGDVLDVESSRGTLVIEGIDQPFMARGPERLVRSEEGAWDLLWPAGLNPSDPPNLADKYRLSHRVGPLIADRPSNIVEISRQASVVERIYLDQWTGLVLRREQLDRAGRIHRSVSFDRLEIESMAVRHSSRVTTLRAPTQVAVDRLEPPFLAPLRLESGYHRIGAYRRGNTVQVLYSDGVYGLSVFQQQGGLDHETLPLDGTAVRVGSNGGRQWSWSGGEIVVFQSGGAVYTIVGDGLPGEVVAAARSLPVQAHEDAATLLDRLRGAATALLSF